MEKHFFNIVSLQLSMPISCFPYCEFLNLQRVPGRLKWCAHLVNIDKKQCLDIRAREVYGFNNEVCIFSWKEHSGIWDANNVLIVIKQRNNSYSVILN